MTDGMARRRRPREAGGDFITLVSTHTVDESVSPAGGVITAPGGPALYVGIALHQLQYPYRLITGEAPHVRVLPVPGGHQYVIPAIPPIKLPPRLEGSAVILSPVIGEVDASRVPPSRGLMVLDLQGFVRDPGVPSQEVGHCFELASLLARADVVKADPAELDAVGPESRRALEHAVVLETRGFEGAVLYEGATRTRIDARPVQTTDTIGAGDTFLAAFVVGLLRGQSVEQSGHFAARFTESMLERRTHPGPGAE